MQTLKIGDHVRHKNSRRSGVVILLHHGLATIALDTQFAMCEGSDVIISEHVCLIENLEIINE